jgi:hypothetical protein
MAGIRPGQAKGPWVGTVIDVTEVTGGANVGTGTGLVFRNRTGHILNFKTLKQGANIVITNNADDVTIAATVPLTAIANVGTGTGLVWRDTIAGTVNLKSIKQGAGITVTNNADDITITCTVTGESTTVANVGTGTGLVYRNMTGTQINLKSIKQGTGITVTNNADDITITASGIAAVANVGTGTGLVWRDTVAGTANLKSVKQGTGITVTNNADDITITCTITQGPTGSGTINYIPKWTAATVLGDSPAIVAGNDIFMADTFKFTGGNVSATPEISVYGDSVGGGFPGAFIDGKLVLKITGGVSAANSSQIRLATGSIIFNSLSAAVDIDLYGNSPHVIATSSAADTAFQLKKRVTVQGVIDNAGSPIAGGATGAPTNINLNTIIGNCIRIAPVSEANRFYKLTNPKNYQIVIILNESDYNAQIYLDTAGSSGALALIPPQYAAATRIGNFALLQYNPNALNGTGAWAMLDIQRQPISVALTDAATIACDSRYGDCLMTVTLGGNRTLGSPGNGIHDGQKIVFRVTQDGTGGRTLAYDVIYRFSTDLPSPTLSTAIGATDYLGFIWNAAATKWDFVGKVFGF